MTPISEFTKIMAYIEAGCGKVMPHESAEVYYDCLGDLPIDVLKAAAKRVVLEHKWATFPTVAEIRQAAVETSQGRLSEITGAEAWRLAWDAVGKIDPEVEGSANRHLGKLPPIVREAIVSMGVPAMCFGQEPVGVIRGQFLKLFEQLQTRDRRINAMPDSVKRIVSDIGRMPEIEDKS